MLEDHKKQEDATKFKRAFDIMSRSFVCEDPIKVATLTLKAHTERDNFDWVVYDGYAWQGIVGSGENFKA